LFNFWKLITKTVKPAIEPIKKIRSPRNDESEIPGNKIKDQNITKTIFAAMIATTAEIEILNIVFEFVPALV
jgi:hypothetical protein